MLALPRHPPDDRRERGPRVKFGCLSCGAKYSVPDGRLEAAGAAGLRIRCSRCRAIMVVAESQRFLADPASGPAVRADVRSDPSLAAREDEDTRKELRVQRRRPQTISADSLSVSSSSSAPMSLASAAMAMSSSSDMDGAPAALSASGVFRALPGVNRQVTGLFFPELEELKAQGKATS